MGIPIASMHGSVNPYLVGHPSTGAPHINFWLEKFMKLYDVPKGTKIRVVAKDKVPPGATPVEGMELNFHAIDGMYSYCTDADGEIYHPAAWTEVEVVE